MGDRDTVRPGRRGLTVSAKHLDSTGESIGDVPTPETGSVPISCPECGAAAKIEPLRRDAADFCPQCDFPLFWARNQLVLADAIDTGGAASRRLPGTVGRAASAAVPCPHCTEPNLPTAQVCIRCGLAMKIVLSEPVTPPPPPAAPVIVPEPVFVAPEPDRWWVWAILAVVTALLVGIAAAVLLRHLFG
jgi:hypothetical protein